MISVGLDINFRLQAANDLAYYISMMDVEDGLSVGIPCVVKLCKDDDYRVRTLIFENLKDVILALLSVCISVCAYI